MAKFAFDSSAAVAAAAHPGDLPSRLARIAPVLAARAADADEGDAFVAENYALAREAGLVEAGVPAELGGGGASVVELAAMLRTMAHACSSTALAFAMHTHQVAIPAWRWRHQKIAAVEPLLRRVAAERLILLSSGGSDWIEGSGTAVRVDGGWRVTARKIFTSGAPAGNLLVTGARTVEEDGTASVIHFAVPMNSPQVRVLDTWRALGMRGTGSHDVEIDGLFVPDQGVALKRRAGEWHPLFRIIATVAFPLIYAVYLGIAERAREVALELARRKGPNEHAIQLAGRMDTALAAARLAHAAMLAEIGSEAPTAETINRVMIGRTLVAENAIRTVELALELAGGAGFYRSNGLERLFRDVQASRFHPLQAGPQARYAGSLALGLPVDRVF